MLSTFSTAFYSVSPAKQLFVEGSPAPSAAAPTAAPTPIPSAAPCAASCAAPTEAPTAAPTAAPSTAPAAKDQGMSIPVFGSSEWRCHDLTSCTDVVQELQKNTQFVVLNNLIPNSKPSFLHIRNAQLKNNFFFFVILQSLQLKQSLLLHQPLDPSAQRWVGMWSPTPPAAPKRSPTVWKTPSTEVQSSGHTHPHRRTWSRSTKTQM